MDSIMLHRDDRVYPSRTFGSCSNKSAFFGIPFINRHEKKLTLYELFRGYSLDG